MLLQVIPEHGLQQWQKYFCETLTDLPHSLQDRVLKFLQLVLRLACFIQASPCLRSGCTAFKFHATRSGERLGGSGILPCMVSYLVVFFCRSCVLKGPSLKTEREVPQTTTHRFTHPHVNEMVQYATEYDFQ